MQYTALRASLPTAIVFLIALILGASAPVYADNISNITFVRSGEVAGVSTSEQEQALLNQIKALEQALVANPAALELRAQIVSLRAQLEALRGGSSVADDYYGVGITSAGYCPNLTRTLQRGMRDAATGGQVSDLQIFLAEYYGLSRSESVSGFFGRTTQLNVIKFQREHGLPALGIVGQMTRAQIAKVCAEDITTAGNQSQSNDDRPVLSGENSGSWSTGYEDWRKYLYGDTSATVTTTNGTGNTTQTTGTQTTAGTNTERSATVHNVKTANTRPTITGTAEGVTRVGLSIGNSGGKVYGSGSGIEVRGGNWSHTINTTLAPGVYTLDVFTTDNVRLATAELVITAPETQTQTGTQVPLTLSAIKVASNSSANTRSVIATFNSNDCSSAGYDIDWGDNDITHVGPGSNQCANGQTVATQNTSVGSPIYYQTAHTYAQYGAKVIRLYRGSEKLSEAQYTATAPDSNGTTSSDTENRNITSMSQITNKREFISYLYTCALGRVGAKSEVDAWINLQVGSMYDMYRGFFASSEYAAKNTSNGAYVDTLYRCVLNRTADNSGRSYWTEQLSGGYSRDNTLYAIMQSTEFQHGEGATLRSKTGLTLPAAAPQANAGGSSNVSNVAFSGGGAVAGVSIDAQDMSDELLSGINAALAQLETVVRDIIRIYGE